MIAHMKFFSHILTIFTSDYVTENVMTKKPDPYADKPIINLSAKKTDAVLAIC